MKLKNIILKSLLKIRKPGAVLYGHNVTINKGEQILPSLHLYPEELERSINSFIQLGIEIISMETLITISKNKFRYKKPWVHFTFDDGYKESASVILPIFEKYKIPFSIFVSSNHIARQERFYTFRLKLSILECKDDIEILGIKVPKNATKEEREKLYIKISSKIKMLTKAELINIFDKIDSILPENHKKALYQKYSSDDILSIEELITLSMNPLVYIGSHSHNHIVFNKNVSADDINFELETSKKWLQDRLARKVAVFCYPDGGVNDYNEVTIRSSKKHYELAFTTTGEFVDKKTNPLLIPRQFLLADNTSIINRMSFPILFIKLKLFLFKIFNFK